jgi:RNA polymerase sigma-70 factor (ECF subfamily)
MPETSFSLLEQIRLGADSAAWSRLVDLYTPLIHTWLHRYGVPAHDSDDLTQEVLSAVVRDLPVFSHDLRRGALRRWLRTITVNRLRNYWRGRDHRPVVVGGSAFDEALAQLEDPESRLSLLWDEEHDRHVLNQLMELIRPEFEPATWNAFQRLVVDGRPSADVAAELNLSVNAVRIAKSRVVRRLRQEMETLIASS